jgi:protein-L-isoaspartate(D-aspartate) O-methyltransferase
MNWTAQRQDMVERQLRARGIRDARVLAAMAAVPRELFVPSAVRLESYQDSPLSIGSRQTISQPWITARMAELLELRGEEKVLEIGAGCGYAAAVLGALTREVITIEVIPALADQARENLDASGYGSNVIVLRGDGSLGVSPHGPFDGISVAAAAPNVPHGLVDQLAPGGRLVIPVGGRDLQRLRLIRKTQSGVIEDQEDCACSFVPLRGRAGWQEED